MSYSVMNSNTDGTITISGVINQVTQTAITGATVTGTMVSEATGATVSAFNAVSFSDQGGGTYTYTYTAGNVPAAGTYTFTITIVKSGVTLMVEHDIVVQEATV